MNNHETLGRAHNQNIPAAPPRFLMCPPRHFAVTYSINPWMNPKTWAEGGSTLSRLAERQWTGLRDALENAGAAIETLEAQPELPDLVFTANAAVVLDGKAMLARFRHHERQHEEPAFKDAFQGLLARRLVDEIVELPRGVRLEGAGDCIWDDRRKLFWMGSGFRSDADAAPALEREFGVRAVALKLADPSFYHLDTAFCPLPCGGVIYYPAAFASAALTAIHERVAPDYRIALDRADAARFAANAVCIGRTIVLSSCSERLRSMLVERGYSVIETLLDVFQHSGGSACCLTLRLDHQSRNASADALTQARRAAAQLR